MFSDYEDFVTDEDDEAEITAREDILRFYRLMLRDLPNKHRRKLPALPHLDEETGKRSGKLKQRKCWNFVIRFVKFTLHFMVVMLILFVGAVGFALIEDPEHQDITFPKANKTLDGYGRLTQDSYADANATVFLMYMEHHFNIVIADSAHDEFVRSVLLYNDFLTQWKKLQKYEKEIHDRQYIFTKWFYFVTIAATTIGYGNVAPATSDGRAFYILFSLVCIPLMMSLLASCGEVMTIFNKQVFRLINKFLCKEKKLVSEELLSAVTLFLFLLTYVATGCVFMASVHHWSLMDSTYFWVVTFTTVGFGDLLIPLKTELDFLLPLTVYRCFGFALLAGFVDSVMAWCKKEKDSLKLVEIKKISLRLRKNTVLLHINSKCKAKGNDKAIG